MILLKFSEIPSPFRIKLSYPVNIRNKIEIISEHPEMLHRLQTGIRHANNDLQ